jgi:alanyl aminopeptidase
MIRGSRSIVMAAIFLAGPGFAADAEPPFRLPQSVIPESYRLDLTIVPDKEQFSGEAEIDIIITEPLDVIWLHGRDLEVKSVRIVTRDGKKIKAKYAQLTPDGMARVTPGKPLAPQRATLRFKYRAGFGGSLNGLYKVSVGDDDYAFSQLESIAARKVFPSFDEPGFKTTFEITVRTRDDYQAFSNTRAIETKKLRRGMKRIRYARTPPLPTYLVAFAVGPLDVVEWAPVPPTPERPEPLPLRGIAVRGQGPRLNFALENTAPILAELEAYFGSPYPFDKLDIVAVPDFAAGAMENAGLITYREPLVLFGQRPSVEQIRRYAMVHTHELAHQWFGNLVTMPWWDDIWLNEAFASWIQAKIADRWDPQFRFDRDTQVRAIHAMREDSLVSARQIREPVESTADIKNAFDAITYQKGAGVLQMLEQYLGEEVFRAGLREHMRRHAFGTASIYDLMDALQEVAGDEVLVEAVFESFLFQAGVPYLTVEKECQDRSARIRISQERFLPAGSAGDPGRIWRVPVCFSHGTSAVDGAEPDRQCVVLSDRTQSFPISAGRRCPAWIMPNAGGAGYYRWRMEPDEFASLANAFPTILNDGERLSFVDSLIAGILNGSVSVTALLDNLPMIASDRDRRVATEPLAAYRNLVTNVIAPELRPAAIEYATKLYLPRLAVLDEAVAADDSPPTPRSPTEDAILRYRLTRFLAVTLGVPALRAELTAAAHRFLGYETEAGPEAAALDPDLLRPALIVATGDGDTRFVEFLIGRFRASDDARFRQAVMEALAFASDADAVKRVREFSLGPDVRGNELDTWLDWLLNPQSQDAAWPWLQANLDAILAIAPERIGRDAPYTFGQWLCSGDDAETLNELFASRVDDFPGSRRNLARALEQIELCGAFRAAQQPAVNAYFAESPEGADAD